MAVISSSEIAKSMPRLRFGMVFSLNTLIGMLLQLIVQSLVTFAFHFQIQQQFVFFGGTLITTGILFIVVLAGIYIWKRKFGSYQKLAPEQNIN